MVAMVLVSTADNIFTSALSEACASDAQVATGAKPQAPRARVSTIMTCKLHANGRSSANRISPGSGAGAGGSARTY